jgi:hypothetical protein
MASLRGEDVGNLIGCQLKVDYRCDQPAPRPQEPEFAVDGGAPDVLGELAGSRVGDSHEWWLVSGPHDGSSETSLGQCFAETSLGQCFAESLQVRSYIRFLVRTVIIAHDMSSSSSIAGLGAGLSSKAR